ncbi:MAG: hypothetical protein K0R39_592 [Symbiobacteriaceae bacterium]|nr:hypothetical protein [Symbiobacteriaceae bacterium]
MMGIRTISGTKVLANLHGDRQTNVKNPVLTVNADGIGQLSVRCTELVAMTGANDRVMRDKVINFAAGIPDEDAWTKEQVAERLSIWSARGRFCSG